MQTCFLSTALIEHNVAESKQDAALLCKQGSISRISPLQRPLNAVEGKWIGPLLLVLGVCIDSAIGSRCLF